MRCHIPLLSSSIINKYIFTRKKTPRISVTHRDKTERQRLYPFLVAGGSCKKGPASHLKSNSLHCILEHSSLIGMHHLLPFPFSLEVASPAYCLINSHLIFSAKRRTTVISCCPISAVENQRIHQYGKIDMYDSSSQLHVIMFALFIHLCVNLYKIRPKTINHRIYLTPRKLFQFQL